MRLTHEDLVAVFGEANVVRRDPTELDGLGLSNAARHALTEVGLPGVIGEGAFRSVRPRILESQASGRRYCLVGMSPTRHYAVDLPSEEVFNLAAWDIDDGPSFLNSNVPAFVHCLAEYGRVQNQLTTDRSEDVSAMWAKRLRERLAAIDPRCLTELNAYFASIVDDIELGII